MNCSGSRLGPVDPPSPWTRRPSVDWQETEKQAARNLDQHVLHLDDCARTRRDTLSWRNLSPHRSPLSSSLERYAGAFIELVPLSFELHTPTHGTSCLTITLVRRGRYYRVVLEKIASEVFAQLAIACMAFLSYGVFNCLSDLLRALAIFHCSRVIMHKFDFSVV